MQVNRLGLMTLLNIDGDELDRMVEDGQLPPPQWRRPDWEEVDPNADPEEHNCDWLWWVDDEQVEQCFKVLRGRSMRNKDIQAAIQETRESRQREVYDPWGGTWNIGRPW